MSTDCLYPNFKRSNPSFRLLYSRSDHVTPELKILSRFSLLTTENETRGIHEAPRPLVQYSSCLVHVPHAFKSVPSLDYCFVSGHVLSSSACICAQPPLHTGRSYSASCSNSKAARNPLSPTFFLLPPPHFVQAGLELQSSYLHLPIGWDYGCDHHAQLSIILKDLLCLHLVSKVVRK
jgi:hypothetical protein